MRVLIIGAGLGGLTLRHGLRRAGVDTQVFERSADDGAQPASYGIHLNDDGLRALHDCLPPENRKRLDEAGVPAPMIVRFHDPRRGVLATIDKRFPATRRLAINRDKLRAALLHDTEPDVHWNKTFIRYEEGDTGVRAFFADGSHADGDLLVGADGSNSPVRRQRLPGLQRRELGILNIAGRVPLTAAALPPQFTDGGINNIVPPRSGWMFLSTWDAEYVVWAWAAAETSYPTGVRDLTGDRLQDLVRERIAGWPAYLRTLVAATDPATVNLVPLRSMPPLPEWTPSRVTLLGDAVHNMTPMAGIGANTALRDADQFRRSLATGPDELAVGSYETAMRAYANQALALSTRNATNAALAGPVSRAAFRLLLRAGSRLPALQRKMFGPVVAPKTAGPAG
jgi:2-polyprenyl-6-methoxyphenol hydroxylase-like FAD-dependent oxidoreductase